MPSVDPGIYKHPEKLLQNLIRFDTTNPPGNEAPCIEYIDNLQTGGRLRNSDTWAEDPNRPQYDTHSRLKGTGTAAPHLLYAMPELVTANNRMDIPAVRRQDNRRLLLGRGGAGHEMRAVE
jgi:hypothetical protein